MLGSPRKPWKSLLGKCWLTFPPGDCNTQEAWPSHHPYGRHRCCLSPAVFLLVTGPDVPLETPLSRAQWETLAPNYHLVTTCRKSPCKSRQHRRGRSPVKRKIPSPKGTDEFPFIEAMWASVVPDIPSELTCHITVSCLGKMSSGITEHQTSSIGPKVGDEETRNGAFLLSSSWLPKKMRDLEHVCLKYFLQWSLRAILG